MISFGIIVFVALAQATSWMGALIVFALGAAMIDGGEKRRPRKARQR